jgi:hypothetical protein
VTLLDLAVFLGLCWFFIRKYKRASEPTWKPELNVTWRSDNILGVYQGVKIAERLKLEDGRTFTFESVAVAQRPGTYFADRLDTSYVVIDRYLLYREISSAM